MGNEQTRESRRANSAPVTGATSSPQAEDIRHRWWWVEHCVWTNPMLARLEENESGIKWFRLWEVASGRCGATAALLEWTEKP